MSLNNTSILQKILRLNVERIGCKMLISYIFSTKVANFQINDIKSNRCETGIDINVHKLLIGWNTLMYM